MTLGPTASSSFVSCVIVAAGSGQRIGAGRNKVLLEVAGRPLLAHTLVHLAASRALNEFVLVVKDGDQEDIAAVARTCGELPPLRFARGGAQRADSVRSGIAATDPRAEFILIHDAARPCVAPDLIARLLDSAARHGAAIPTLPVVDTIKRVHDGMVLGTLDRSELHAAQTPQAFRASALRSALTRIPSSATPTDDASWFESLGLPVASVPGDSSNIKITTPHDLERAPALLAAFRAHLHPNRDPATGGPP